MDAEVDIASLNTLMHQANVWNDWDKIEKGNIDKYEPLATISSVNKNSMGKLSETPKRCQTSSKKKRTRSIM